MTFIERAFKKEAWAEGEDYGSIKTLWGLQKDGRLSLSDVASEANLSVVAFKAKVKELKAA